MNGTNNNDIIRVGSRKSELALIQTKHVIKQLEDLYPDKKFEIIKMSTTGDKILDKPLPKIGEKSLFTKELEIALEQNIVDFVVHSLKDLPTILPDGMCIGAVLEREDPRDAVMLHPSLKARGLEDLPPGSVVGTSSLRRTAQLRRRFPALRVSDIRGNLNTRLRKLEQGQTYQALVLAAAGLRRMGWQARVAQCLSEQQMLYAVGQGALAVECAEADLATLRLLEPLAHPPTSVCVLAERAFLRALGGGCSAPVAVSSVLQGARLSLTGAAWSLDGARCVQNSASTQLPQLHSEREWEPRGKCPYRLPHLFCGLAPAGLAHADLEAAEALGEEVALALAQAGARELMAEARADPGPSPTAAPADPKSTAATDPKQTAAGGSSQPTAAADPKLSTAQGNSKPAVAEPDTVPSTAAPDTQSSTVAATSHSVAAS